jgi:hypothetical protein
MDNPSINIFCAPSPILAGAGDGNPAESVFVSIAPNTVSNSGLTVVTLIARDPIFTNVGNETIHVVNVADGSSVETPPTFVSATEIQFSVGVGCEAGLSNVVYGSNTGTWNFNGSLIITV